MKEPKDLGVKIGSKDEVFWTEMEEKAEGEILNNRREIEINEAIISHARTRIRLEKEKFK